MSHNVIADCVAIRGRFHRSVNLVGDWAPDTDLSGYVVTPTVRDLADRIGAELAMTPGGRTWSITGPYGSGKSAFVLFLADTLCCSAPHHQEGAAIRASHEMGNKRLLPVLLTTERRPLKVVLRQALIHAFRPIDLPFVKRLKRHSKDQSNDQFIKILEDAARVARKHRRTGLFLAIDELGKFLEFAADPTTSDDVYFLQQLAEAASRSEIPIVFLTVLHSAFANYLPPTADIRRSEWQKVQGRFEDVAFQLPAEQMLGLISRALVTAGPRELESAWDTAAQEFLESPVAEDIKPHVPIDELARSVMPLHPLTALLLWPIFRSKVAQNERSLFAFLTSSEPFGFQEFLRTTHTDGDAPLYRVSQLYDYLVASLGISAFRGPDARRWAMIEEAIERVPADSDGAADVVKTIGLLSVYGKGAGVRASLTTIAQAVGAKDTDIKSTIGELEERSIVVFRRHQGSYGLWEGSDFDLDRAFEHAKSQLPGGPVADRLNALVSLRPVVARAHYITSGTLRVFELQVVGGQSGLRRNDNGARGGMLGDGVVAFLMTDSTDSARSDAPTLARELAVSASGSPLVVAIPQKTGDVRSALDELEAWQWVAQHSPELQGDGVARQEVRARIAEAEATLEVIVGSTFGLPGHHFDPGASRWFFRGEEAHVKTARAFQRWLSTVCDEVYSEAPMFHNELLNREHLSSAAAAARRNLLERIVEHGDTERLGITGNPPEASMYESMLRAGGFHRTYKGSWRITAPPPRSPWRPAWKALTQGIAAAAEVRRPVTEILDLLKGPPFGMREGPLPVLLTILLVEYAGGVALYEDGLFVPELRIEVLERLLRRPETFEIQSHRLSRAEQRLLRKLQVVASGSDFENTTPAQALTRVAKSLVLFAAGLKPFARQTRRFDTPHAATVRDALLRATDPKDLLLRDLPSIWGVEIVDAPTAAEFADTLRSTVDDISRSYPRLLDDIEHQTRAVFGLEGTAEEAVRQLQQRALPLLPYAVEPHLVTFVKEMARPAAKGDWRERVGRCVNTGLPPSHWTDHDATAFQVRLSDLVDSFGRLEELAAVKAHSGATTVLRLGYLDGHHKETRAVIPYKEGLEREVAPVLDEVLRVLCEQCPDARVRLATVARLAQNVLDDVEEGDGADV